MARLLHQLVRDAAQRDPGAVAVRDPHREATYGELDGLADAYAVALRDLGVSAGDRVGVWLPKSVDAVAAMQGALRLGAAYVPIDPMSPAARAATILDDCSVAALVTEHEPPVGVLVLRPADAAETADAAAGTATRERLDEPDRAEHDLAYILYTSGSTGKPKGVMISHRNALAFVEWAVDEVKVQPGDRLSSHAPFHFDLSVFDLYAAFSAGASVNIVPEGSAYAPRALVEFVVGREITVWYSVPSALIMMMDSGGLLDEPSLPWHTIVFAGEPFPVKQLRRLREAFPTARLLNWYGPTETNVCTAYEVFDIPADRTAPVPIGQATCGDRVWAVKEDGTPAAPGEEGELLCEGPTVLMGYWGKEPHGDRPYATGDIVKQQDDGNYVYVGRRDHMVKVRGHRVELGEIEAALLAHPDVEETAVVVAGSGMEARLVAFVRCPDETPSLLAFKRHCAERLPRYMIVDEVRTVTDLPRTGNGKIDRLRLTETATTGGAA